MSLLCGAIALQALLAGCGGGGGDGTAAGAAPGTASGASDSPPPSTSATGATATISGPSDSKAAWHISTPLSVSLKDAQGNALSGITCAAADATKLTVAGDCSSVSGLRLGAQQIVVSSGANSAKVSVTVTPQRTWIGTSNSSAGGYNIAVLGSGNIALWGYAGGSSSSSLLDQNKTQAQLSMATLPLLGLDSTGTQPLTGIMQVSAGYSQALAVSEEGRLWKFGVLPTRIQNSANNGQLESIVQAAAGDGNYAALLDDGSVVSWGQFTGQGLAGGGFAQFPAPVVKTDGTALTGIASIASGTGFTVALASDGRVWSWGDNNGGSAGAPTTTNVVIRANTVKLADGNELTGIVSIAVGYDFVLALTDKGTVFAWGNNQTGILGQGNQYTTSSTALAVKNSSATAPLTGIAMIAAGQWHALALDTSGSVMSWGHNGDSELGRGPNVSSGTGDRSLPGPVVSTGGAGQLSGIKSIAAGAGHSLALQADGTVLIWGAGFGGNLGQGSTSTANQPTPTPVKAVGGTGVLTLKPTDYPNLMQKFR